MTWHLAFLEQLSEHWIEALINFAATFAGVAFSFWVERLRSTKQEKDDFGKLLQCMFNESAHNYAVLQGIKECSSVGKIPAFSLSNHLVLVPGNPVFHRWAIHSLVLTATVVSTHMEFVNNLLAGLRAATIHYQMSDENIGEWKEDAERGQKLIVVMQDQILEELPKFG